MTSGRRNDTKTCQSCGRVMSWRKSWARTWDEVRYCSDACRRHRVSDVDRALERAILELLRARPRSATMCPSEAVLLVAGDDQRAEQLTEPSRRAVRRLAADGRVEVLQAGRVVDPSTARGAIRVRLVDA